MTSEDRQYRNHLCRQIEVEKDHRRFTRLMKELFDLLDGKAHRLEDKPSAPNTKI
jgi:hypothetical protein